jgi:epsilon-lactone hydrolase
VEDRIMKIKKIAAIILSLIIISVGGYAVITSTVFKPSIGSMLARLVIRAYLAPAFASENPIGPVRNSIGNVSKLALLPCGTVVEKAEVPGMNAEWVTSPGADRKSGKALLYIHGGAFFSGSPETHRELVARISAASGLPALVIDYRLAPEHKFPAALDDCVAAYSWLLKQGFNPKKLVIGGDSAGGCLAVMTLLKLREKNMPLPGAAVLISPLTDAVHYEGESLATRAGADPWFNPKDLGRHLSHFIGTGTNQPAILSPVRADLSGLPPMLVQVGDDEILLSDSTRLVERAKKAGVDATVHVFDHMYHDFQMFAVVVPEAREAIAEMGAFIKKHVK